MYGKFILLIVSFVFLNFSISGCSGSDGKKIEDESIPVRPVVKNSADRIIFKVIEVKKDTPTKIEDIQNECGEMDFDFDSNFKSFGEVKAVSKIDEDSNIYIGYKKGIAKLKIDECDRLNLVKEARGLYYIEDIVTLGKNNLLLISDGYDGLKKSDSNLTKIEDINSSAKVGWSGEIEYLRESNIYVAHGSAGIELIRYDSYQNKLKSKNYDLNSSYVQSIELSSDGMLAFVSAGYGGFSVLSLLDDEVILLSNIKNSDWVYDLEYVDDRGILYIAAGKNGVDVYDLQHADHPKKIFQYDLNSSIEHLRLLKDQNILLAADDKSVLYIFDINEDNTLEFQKSISLEGIINQIKYDQNMKKIFIATTKGLFIYDLNN